MSSNPRKNLGSCCDARLSVRLTTSQYNYVVLTSNNWNCSPSDVIRFLIDKNISETMSVLDIINKGDNNENFKNDF